MFPGCALDSGVSLRAEGRKVRVELAACSPGVLMPLADPCARRELDRKACLIHESPAEVLWGFWLHCPFSVKRELEENRTTPEPRIARRISLMWESGRARLCPGVMESYVHLTLQSCLRTGSLTWCSASLQKSYSVMFVDLCRIGFHRAFKERAGRFSQGGHEF